jgi:hypothetical protein
MQFHMSGHGSFYVFSALPKGSNLPCLFPSLINHVRAKIKQTPAWPNFTGYVGVRLL